ncbi:hypothetical protein BpHYR1_017702 [Brachionus plicatilis]|uniref:Uncharacterized protein n=1 Tax=Brachionus plicatilis TaxID=10195 RepID=A0A3M7S8N8_BRAPC|nr:hypothetical protein BpHYR1_017702 [Brachionus plicatilis]
MSKKSSKKHQKLYSSQLAKHFEGHNQTLFKEKTNSRDESFSSESCQSNSIDSNDKKYCVIQFLCDRTFDKIKLVQFFVEIKLNY